MRLALVAAVCLVAGCDLFSEVDPPSREPLAPATYAVTFEATWSAETHPEAFPPDPHFSRLTGAAHTAEVSLWRLGAVASDGVRAMAETGSMAGLRAEVEALGDAAAYVEGDPLRPSPGTAGATVTVTDARPVATVVSMLAPSPDWFVGVDGLDLRDGDGWADRVVVDAVVYDAGTDDGAGYTAPDAPRTDRAPIAAVAYAPLAGTVVGRLVFERQ
ncbi:spondin domain-containing protein [Rubrivirga sp. IMCC43871]|uniref:spondin domain-containing protein n=1 Tax=Rubrivirga sp. IMCC43871 TaxID=3391575 RepID=UPI00398FE243